MAGPAQPSDKHRAWAEMLRTAAAVAILALAAMEFGTKTGWW